MRCIFCANVIAKEDSLTVYRDDTVIVFLDRFPRTRGHVCVAPVAHYASLFDTPAEISNKVMGMVVDFSKVLKDYGAKGINIGSNVGEVAGQQVPHFHVHVIPRYEKGDAIEIEPAFVDTPWRSKSLKLSEEEMRQICNDLAALFRERR